ncbi:MFS transporter [Streptacidiphilus albus]|uniref:MFS transporter n=1 Tax=Streptacidiphilus albus TaxID=105425 RepID=UPI000A620A28|nr:MFS transporter [Streptacidiphilus albus]
MTDTQDQPQSAAAPASTAPPSAPPRAVLGLAALALFVASANLRPAIAAVSPLADRIQAGLGLDSIGVSLLTALPTLAMGLCAPLAAAVGRRIGLHAGVLLGLTVIAVGSLARGAAATTWLQLSCAAVVGGGIAIAQTLLPAVVKTRFASRASLVTGLYTVGLGLGGAVAAGVSAPLADAFDSWPGALASWSVLAVAGMAVWLAAKRSLDLDSLAGPGGPVTKGLPWRSSTAWCITVISAGNSALYYCELTWIAPLLQHDGGRSASDAGFLLTVMISIQVVAMLTVPMLLGERIDRRIGLIGTSLLTGIGFLGFALSPGAGAWVWLVAMGIGHGGLFTLVLTLPVSAARNPVQAGRFSAMAFFVGYGCAAVLPVVVGELRDATGNFRVAFTVLAAVAALLVIPMCRMSPRRFAMADPAAD